jgi:hypothetical protein
MKNDLEFDRPDHPQKDQRKIIVKAEGENKSLRWTAFFDGKPMAVSYLSALHAKQMAIQRIPFEELPERYR